jgi:hypothetical protein
MNVKQIYSIMNDVTGEVIGKTDLVKEDLTNIVDVGTEIFDGTSVDLYVKSLVNHIGRVIFKNRPYAGGTPSVLMDSWEFGSVCEKISAETPEASENESWSLTDGTEYKQDIFYQPKVTTKFFNKMVTFEVPMSFTEKQVKQSFSDASQLNAFISMIYNAVEKSMTVKIDSLTQRTINNMIGETIKHEFPSVKDSNYSNSTSVKAVNLLKLYNDTMGTTLEVSKALVNPEFIRFASLTMTNYIDRLGRLSTLFNVGGKDRFTSKDMLHVVMLSDFKASANAYLQGDTIHNEYTALPNAETVPYWQASGKNYAFDDVSRIHVNVSDNTEINIGGILGIMFDRDALGVCNTDRRVTTNYNAKGEFFNNYYKFDASYFNDLNENFVVFFIA